MARAIGEPALQRLAVFGFDRRVDFRRGAAQLVELLQRRLQHVSFARSRDCILGAQLHALDDAAVADLEDLDDEARWAELEAEYVAVPELDCRHFLLPIVKRLDGPQRVAHLRRLFEPLPLGGREHPRPQRLHELVVPPFEEQLRQVDRAPVLVLRTQRVHARGDAALDVVLEARPPALAGDDFVARPDPEQPVRERHGLAREGRGQERSRIEAAVALHAARDEHAGKRLVGRQLEVRIVLVVAQQDVVLRRALLDEVILERERFDDRVGDDHFQPRDFAQQRVGLRVAAGAKIIPDAVAQRARFADVNGVATRVEVQVHSRLLGQPGNLFLEFVDGHTLLCRGSAQCLNPPFYVSPVDRVTSDPARRSPSRPRANPPRRPRRDGA